MSKLHSCVLGPGYTMNVAITSYYVGSNTFKSVQPIRKVTKSDKVWGLCRASLLWSCPSQMVAAGHLSHLRKFGEDETDLNGSWFSLPSPGMFATCMLGAHRQDKSLKPFWIRVSMDIFEHLPLPGFVVRIKVFYCGRKMSKGEKGRGSLVVLVCFDTKAVGPIQYKHSVSSCNYREVSCGDFCEVYSICKRLGGHFASRLLQFLGSFKANKKDRHASG